MKRLSLDQRIAMIRRWPPPRRLALVMLLARASRHEITAAERREQMISFAYGNAAIENPAVTREMAARSLGI